MHVSTSNLIFSKKFLPTTIAIKHEKNLKCQTFHSVSSVLPGFGLTNASARGQNTDEITGFFRILVPERLPKSTKMADTATPLRPARASKQSGKDSAVIYSDLLFLFWNEGEMRSRRRPNMEAIPLY